MDDTFAQRVRTAAVAGWWTTLIAVIWLTVTWLLWLPILSVKPAWILTLWGGGMSWQEVQGIVIRFFAVFKLLLFVFMMVTIWLTIWGRKLKKLAGQ